MKNWLKLIIKTAKAMIWLQKMTEKTSFWKNISLIWRCEGLLNIVRVQVYRFVRVWGFEGEGPYEG